jgi:UDP-N-acetylglucosamine--N-acetylmuramyl-(pentapeptide) pyrophosphoryl-undecaprenol N-acetylglucosamine transferase
LYQQEAPEKSLAPELKRRYHAAPYLHDTMALALAAADLSVARAGASSLGEFPIARLPSILAPLLGVNQQQNAAQLAQRGAAVVIDDDKLASRLTPKLIELIEDEPRRRLMEGALAELAQPEAAMKIARELHRLAVNAQSSATSYDLC